MVACRRSFALSERRQPKMLPELLHPRSLLRGERPGKVGAAIQEVVHDCHCDGGLRWIGWHCWCERRVRFQPAAARAA